MKTKTILKTLAVALLMPAMLLTSACSSEDDLVNNTAENTEAVANKGYALPVTVSATRQGDGTRATYNESTKKLNFSTGDKLFVYGSATAAGSFAGELTWQSGGTFSGTIYTQKEWTGTPDALFTAASAGEDLTATLLPNGYGANGSNSFLSINNNSTTDIAYDDRLTVSFSKAFVASETAKATGVEQLSLERTSTYSSGFALAPLCAILNFTITGLEAGPKNVSLQLSGFDNTVTGSVTPNAGVATFAIGVSGGANIKDMDNNLTVGTHNFTLPSTTTLTAGKIYNITRAVPAATSLSELKTAINGGTDCSSYIGWEVNSEGAIAKSGVSGTKIGYVAYVSTSDVDANVSGSRILVIASADAGTDLQWGSKGTARGVEAVAGANNLNGYSNTNTLQGYGSGAHPAAYAAWNYSATIPSGGASPAHWFMPTRKQWENMRDAKGGTYGAMSTAYGIDGHYWTSSEYFNGNSSECANYAWRFVTNSNIQGNMKSLNYNVRSIFAY